MKLKVFVSSTCYDLGIVRAQLRSFIEGMGYEPVMSEYDDVLYDPKNHTHESCVNAIEKCDMVILLIGSRFGGEVVPSVLSTIDFDMLQTKSKKTQMIDTKKLSITQCEILKAIENNIPIYTFILEQVLNDHLFYEKNKKEKTLLLKKVKFPSGIKNEHASFIFDFINFMRARSENNAYMKFSKIEDIENCLKKQWSGLFQSLLEQTRKVKESYTQTQILSSQIDELKAMLMSTVRAGDMRDAAKGVSKYRIMLSIIDGISQHSNVIFEETDWKEVLKQCEIVDVKSIPSRRLFNKELAFIKKDNSFFLIRPIGYDEGRIKNLWDEFVKLKTEIKKAIVEAVRDMGPELVRYSSDNFNDFYKERFDANNDNSSGMQLF